MKNEKAMNIALLTLRVVLGAIFIAHGAQKVFGVFGGGGIEPFSVLMENLGMTPPLVWAWTVALAELVSGVFLVLGILPRISAGVVGIIMVAAITWIHAPAGFFMKDGGFEYQMLILASCVCIMLMGAGKFSIFDRL